MNCIVNHIIPQLKVSLDWHVINEILLRKRRKVQVARTQNRFLDIYSPCLDSVLSLQVFPRHVYLMDCLL